MKGIIPMKGLKRMLLEEQKRLEQIIQTTKASLKDAPEGTLRVSKHRKYTQYYHRTDENKQIQNNGKYIKKNEQELVWKLAQKAYDEKVLTSAEKRLIQIQKITEDYEDDEIENIYRTEHMERQKFIRPVVKTWEEKYQEWAAEVYQGLEFKEDVPLILTERGERVRSKSEKIMADYFYRNGIFYKYERPLLLKGFGIVYPDFTFLSPKSGEEIYWEHNGRMDDPAYARKAVNKILLYENNQIYVGEKLILTYETEQTVLNTRTIESMVERYLVDHSTC